MWKRKKTAETTADGAGAAATASLRDIILRTPPNELGFAPADDNQVYGVLMETGYDAAIVTIVSLEDGTTSMYFSNGGGTIGAGGNERVAEATKAFVAAAAQSVAYAGLTSDFPSPGVGEVRFQILTHGGGLTAAAPEGDLGEQRSPLSPLFYAGQDVITAIRILKDGSDA